MEIRDKKLIHHITVKPKEAWLGTDYIENIEDELEHVHKHEFEFEPEPEKYMHMYMMI